MFPTLLAEDMIKERGKELLREAEQDRLVRTAGAVRRGHLPQGFALRRVLSRLLGRILSLQQAVALPLETWQTTQQDNLFVATALYESKHGVNAVGAIPAACSAVRAVESHAGVEEEQ
jgi:hypothetical protein